jgi:hypothetical protein
MPHVTIERPDVSLEDAEKALRQQLGDRYTVSPGSAQSLKVSTSTLAYANVHLRKEGEGVVFAVHGGGIVIGRIINELTLARKVADALRTGLAGP